MPTAYLPKQIPFECFFYRVGHYGNRGVKTGPQAELLGALLDKHAESIDSQTIAFSGHGQELCIKGVIYYIHYDHSLSKDILRDDALLCTRLHAYGCGVDQYVRRSISQFIQRDKWAF